MQVCRAIGTTRLPEINGETTSPSIPASPVQYKPARAIPRATSAECGRAGTASQAMALQQEGPAGALAAGFVIRSQARAVKSFWFLHCLNRLHRSPTDERVANVAEAIRSHSLRRLMVPLGGETRHDPAELAVLSRELQHIMHFWLGAPPAIELHV